MKCKSSTKTLVPSLAVEKACADFNFTNQVNFSKSGLTQGNFSCLLASPLFSRQCLVWVWRKSSKVKVTLISSSSCKSLTECRNLLCSKQIAPMVYLRGLWLELVCWNMWGCLGTYIKELTSILCLFPSYLNSGEDYLWKLHLP